VDSSRQSPEAPNYQGTLIASTNLQHVLVKWTGEKSRQAKQIVAQFPHHIVTYIEPFLGGGSVLYELLGSDIEDHRFEVRDACEPSSVIEAVVTPVMTVPLPIRSTR
jgi:hypothetical protein